MPPLDRRRFLATSLAGAGAAATPVAQAALVERPGRTPHTKFAVNVEMWWTGLPFMERFAKVAELGFPAVEFWPFQGRDIDAIATTCKALGLEVAQFTAWGFKPGMNDPQNEDAFVQTIEEACAVAHRLDCRKMTVVAGDDIPGVSQADMHAQVVKALRRAAPIAERERVMLILEPMNVRVDHQGHCLFGSPPTIAICEAVDSEYVKINWDLYHMQITEGDLCGRMKEGFRWIGYLQLADHPGRHEPGTGEVHYNRVLREAHDLGYRDFVGLECHPTDEVEAARRVAAADVW